MSYQKSKNDIIIKKIETDKENRAKNIYCFTLSMTLEEEKLFNEKLKNAIDEINQTKKKKISTETLTERNKEIANR